MPKNKPLDFIVHILVVVLLITAAIEVANAASLTQATAGQDSRAIGDTAFTVNNKRPVSPVRRPAAARRKYRRVTQPLSKTTARTKTSHPGAELVPVGDAEIGVTVWRLIRAGENEQGARQLQISAPDGAWLPTRVAAESPLAEGDRVRLSVETPRDGYLYVFDREQYADGTYGDPYLIFPLSITRQGDNRVRAGVVVEIPAQTDPTPYFTLRPSSVSQTGEVLTVIVTSKPLAGVPLEASPVRFDGKQVASWLKQWSAPFERFEMEGGAGQTYTAAEKAAGADKNRGLRIGDPTPQTIYRLAPLAGNPLLINVTLPIRR